MMQARIQVCEEKVQFLDVIHELFDHMLNLTCSHHNIFEPSQARKGSFLLLQEEVMKKQSNNNPSKRKHMNWSRLLDEHSLHPHITESKDRLYCTSYH